MVTLKINDVLLSAGHAMPIRSLTFSPDSQLLITASDDSHIKMYDVYHSRSGLSTLHVLTCLPFPFPDLIIELHCKISKDNSSKKLVHKRKLLGWLLNGCSFYPYDYVFRQ